MLKDVLNSDDLLGLIVHSYNNYLAGMMGYSELALLECENSEVEERLNRSLESGYDAVHLGKTILASIGRLQVPMKEHSLEKIMCSFFEKRSRYLDVSELKFPENIQIKTDVFWFDDCLLDLIDFASQSKEGVKVPLTCEIKQKDKMVKVGIHCNNVILTDKQLKYLFEPFYSSRNILAKKDIGLAKAKGFFEQMNASLNWENHQGFTLEIPFNN